MNGKMKGKIKGLLLLLLMIVGLFSENYKLKAEAAVQPVDLTFLSYCDEKELAKWDERLGYLDEKQANEIKNYIENYIVKDEKDDYEKARLIYDWIYANVRYAHYANETPYINPYDIFTKRTAVCGGYSNLYKAMLNLVGIPSVVFGGDTIYGAHAWNAVCVNGEWFYSDSTWGGKYFDIGTDEFLKEHMTYRIEFVSIETETGLLLGYDKGLAVVGVQKNMTSVNVPETYKELDVTSVSYQLFNSQYGIKELNVGKNVNNISDIYCATLEKINVSKDNEQYASKDGVLFSKDLTSLLIYPAEKKDENFTLPKETKNFDLKGTFNNRYLVNLEVEKGNEVFSSYKGALYDAEQKELLMVPMGKTEVYVAEDAVIGDVAFANADTGKMTIYAKAGSPAHQYAIQNNISFVEKTVDVLETFNDLSEGHWYVPYVQYVYEKGIMTGIHGKVFEPETEITRAMVVETLYKMEKRPVVKDFTKYHELRDLSEGDWWDHSVAWSLNTGVATGYLNFQMFKPTVSVTREQVATFLYRYGKYKGMDTKINGNPDEILKGVSVSDWAKEAFAWAVEQKLITGIENRDAVGNVTRDLSPKTGTTRAQMAAILQRFCENVKESK